MKVDVNKLLKVIRLSAQVIIENGGEIYRAEETMKFIGEAFGVREIDSIATPTGFYMTISVDGEDNSTLVKRISRRTIDLQKINDVNNISRKLSQHSITLDEALAELENINNRTNLKIKQSILYAGLSSAFFTVLFGGKILDFVIAFCYSNCSGAWSLPNNAGRSSERYCFSP